MRSSSPLSDSRILTRSRTGLCNASTIAPVTSSGLPVLESPCSDAIQFQIKRIPSEFFETCCGRYGGKRRNSRIAKYRQEIVALTFLGIEKYEVSKLTTNLEVITNL